MQLHLRVASLLVLAFAAGCGSSKSSNTCGNGTLDPGETCDPKDSAHACPTDCDDGNACTLDGQTGAAASCTAACSHTPISTCSAGDGCCPAGCNHANDADCSASCGNGVVDPGETCDGANCPTDCNDGSACTTDTLTGSAANCSAACSHTSITSCLNGDGCCPAGCNHNNDTDCSASCGNGTVEQGETCDGSNCPTDCNDSNACTIDTLNGSASACSAACSHTGVTQCKGGDGCCPAGCNHSTDSDCSASCGNGIVEVGETCDGVNCPTNCADGNACTIDALTGSAATCSASCTHAPITQCTGGDGCCPPGCTHNNDSDCSATCGNGTIEAPETCDGNCPSSCNDGNACTKDSVTGSALNCSAACSFQPITTCTAGDGCCPAGCNAANDSDCSAFCGDHIIEAGETCDGACPTSCSDGNACTVDTLTGVAANCTSACSFVVINTCTGGDGCCPAGCNHNNDSDCSATCGNGTIEAGEKCDGNCPSSCNDSNACTIDTLIGSAGSCSAQCLHQTITQCANGDGCCPNGCNNVNDNDCLGTSPIGGACSQGSDCASGACFPEASSGLPGGYCTLGCTAGGNECGGMAHCGVIGADNNGFCLANCSGNPSCTRTHYQCYDADGAGTNECFAVADGGGGVGDKCSSAASCGGGQNGFCLTQLAQGFKDGYCSQGCIPSPSPNPSPSPIPCPGNNVCADLGLGNMCWKACASDTDCRGPDPGTGFKCLNFGGAIGAVCTPTANGSGAVGDACTGYFDCDGGLEAGGLFGTCLGFTNGYCSQLCGTDQVSMCPNGSHCVQNVDGSTISACLKDCRTGADCRQADGYVCQMPPMTPTLQCIQ